MAQDLTDTQWPFIAPLLPQPPKRADGRGRPWRASRAVLTGMLWILRTGAHWAELPRRSPPYQPCPRRFQQWQRAGVMARLLAALARDLEQRGQITLAECFVDGSFSAAKKGGPGSARPSGARAARAWRLQPALVFLSPSPQPVLRRMRRPSSAA